MSQGFWGKLHKKRKAENLPIVVLAPMADVTDQAFRRIIAKYSKMGSEDSRLDVMWSEFVSSDGLCHEEGKNRLLIDLKFTEAERPIVAQLFTSKPENMRKTAKLIAELGFDALDINMGCPDRSIEKQGCGASLIKNPKLARELIKSAKEGIKDAKSEISVSVKTRIGYLKNEIQTWIPELLAENPAVITIHARTRKEMSKVPVRWEHVKEAVNIRDGLDSETLIFGNGDVLSIEEADKKYHETGCDGVMIGKGIFGNPALFLKDGQDVSVKEKLKMMIEHTWLFEELLGGHKSFALMKKHYKAYVNGFDGAKELRMELMETNTAVEVEKITKEFIKTVL